MLHAPAGARAAALSATALALWLPAALPATALAAPVAEDPQVLAAYGVAKVHWSAEPCGSEVRLRWIRLERSINALARWTAQRLDDPLTYSACRVELNVRAEWDWPKLCTVVVHELGHLLGLPHSPDPGDVMHDFYTPPLERCARRRAPPCRAPDGTRPATRAERRALCPATRS